MVIVHYKISLKPKAFMAMLHDQTVLPSKIAFRKTQIMNRIKQVGFTNTILTINANNRGIKLKLFMKIVLELK
jgi:hypothetical protein